MLGDNIDVTITPSKMTSDAQRKSLHWFFVMMKLKNITVKDMDVSEVCLCLSQVHVLSTFLNMLDAYLICMYFRLFYI